VMSHSAVAMLGEGKRVIGYCSYCTVMAKRMLDS
jgi:hypothetical protein